MPRVTDALGRAIEVPERPRRIVSLVPSQTELLADLGLDAEVVGVTKFCVHPEAWRRQKIRVGGTKRVHLDRVRGLAPDLVLANKEENEREAVEAIAAFAPVYVTDVRTVAGAVEMVRAVGALVGRADAARTLADRIERGFASLARRRPVRAAYLIWRDPWMAVGADTFIHDVMTCAGFANVFGGRARYPEVAGDELAAARPEVVLLSSEPFPFADRHVPEVARIVPDARVLLVDGQLFSWYGSRIARAPAYFRSLHEAGAR